MSRALDLALAPSERTASLAHEGLADEVLVLRGADGDGVAFAELVRRHQSKVRGLLLRLTGNRVLADDLSQDGFLRAFRGLVGFEGRARFATWLYRIAYNVFLNHRARFRTLHELPDDYEAAVAPDDLGPARGDLRRDLEVAILALPERYRAVITLHYIDDVSYPEIAEILDIPLGTVKTHLHRAKRLLRESMTELGHGA